MCVEKMKLKFYKTFYINFATGFKVTKLTILSTVKYTLKYTDFRHGNTKLYYDYSVCITFPQYVTKGLFLMIVSMFVNY